jgi:hypothetical protein
MAANPRPIYSRVPEILYTISERRSLSAVRFLGILGLIKPEALLSGGLTRSGGLLTALCMTFPYRWYLLTISTDRKMTSFHEWALSQ